MQTIYKLIDPDTLEPRYIGQTERPLKARLNGHLSEKVGRKGKWIQSLIESGKLPIIEEIETVPDELGDDREQEIISLYRDIYPNLLNGKHSTRKNAIVKLPDNERLSVRDVGGKLRAIFARIGARVEVGGDMAAGVRYAASFTDGATRQERAPLDWAELTLDTLRTLTVYGYDHFTRAEALRRIEEGKDTSAIECCDTLASWVDSRNSDIPGWIDTQAGMLKSAYTSAKKALK